jgi:hypothetical protein
VIVTLLSLVAGSVVAISAVVVSTALQRFMDRRRALSRISTGAADETAVILEPPPPARALGGRPLRYIVGVGMLAVVGVVLAVALSSRRDEAARPIPTTVVGTPTTTAVPTTTAFAAFDVDHDGRADFIEVGTQVLPMPARDSRFKVDAGLAAVVGAVLTTAVAIATMIVNARKRPDDGPDELVTVLRRLDGRLAPRPSRRQNVAKGHDSTGAGRSPTAS